MQQCQNISFGAENTSYSQTLLQMLVTLYTPVLKQAFQTAQDMMEHYHAIRYSNFLA